MTPYKNWYTVKADWPLIEFSPYFILTFLQNLENQVDKTYEINRKSYYVDNENMSLVTHHNKDREEYHNYDCNNHNTSNTSKVNEKTFTTSNSTNKQIQSISMDLAILKTPKKVLQF